MEQKLRGAIVVNAYFLGESARHQLQRILGALKDRGATVDVVSSDSIPVYLDGKEVVSRIGGRDFIVFLDKDPHLSYALEKAGYRLFNSAKAVELCDDKMRTCIALCGKVSMPRTVSSPLMYQETEEHTFATRVGELLGYPVVVKKSFGSMGYGVELAKNKEELQIVRAKWRLQPHLYQEFLSESAGRDIRVIVVGGTAVGAMQRYNPNDFRSNVEQGGQATAIELTEEIAAIAEKTATALELDYCGVDLLSYRGGYAVCEVNSNAYFRAFEQATGVDVAGNYADFILSECKKTK